MDNWWSLGEGGGYQGNELAFHRITCPFCMQHGNFKVNYHAEKKHHQDSKVLNFDTLECGNCKGYVMVLWSASSRTGRPGTGFHDYRVLPWPLTFERVPEHWPAAIGRYWLQAKRNLRDGNWDAAAVMARSALQLTLRDHEAEGRNLKQEIEHLAGQGVLPPTMKDWSDNVRELGNDSAHPKPEQIVTASQDAKDVVRFLDFLLEYLYDLPYQIKQYRDRAEGK